MFYSCAFFQFSFLQGDHQQCWHIGLIRDRGCKLFTQRCQMQIFSLSKICSVLLMDPSTDQIRAKTKTEQWGWRSEDWREVKWVMFHTYSGIRYWKLDSLFKGTLECVYKDSYIAWEADRGVKRWARSWCHTLWGLQGFQAYTGTPLSSAPRRINCTSTSTAMMMIILRAT